MPEDRTLALGAQGVALPPHAGAPPPQPPGESRTTVLPRISLVGRQPTFVVDRRVRYELRDPLGEGGMGEVLRAHDHDIGRDVALKRLKGQVRSPEAVARFVNEIRMVGFLQHPNIVPIHDVGVDENGEYYFVMKLVEGETLQSIIARLAARDPEYHARYGFERRIQIFRGLLEAVAFAHSRGVIHRDLKPANVMVGAYGEVLLMDWGAAKAVRGDTPTIDGAVLGGDDVEGDEEAQLFRTRLGSLVGTPAYMSPEQARGETLDERSDVYSLCVLLHELLTLQHYLAGRKTLTAMLLGVQEQEPKLAVFVHSPHQPAPPADLAWFAEGGLRKDPARRYPSVAAMIDRYDRRAAGHIPIQCPYTFQKRLALGWGRLIDRQPVATSLVTIALLAGLLTAAGWALLR